MRKVFYIIVLVTALITVGIQQILIIKLESDIEHQQVLYDEIEKIVAEMHFN